MLLCHSNRYLPINPITNRNATKPRCVKTTCPFVKVSPAMALNIMLFFRHQFKNLCFIMLVVLVITVPCNSVARSLVSCQDSNL